MQTARILQAVVLMMIVALAASCAASKEYSSKLFKPRIETIKDSQTTALRFLELDSLQTEKDGWVTTDIIMGRDTGSKTVALDNLVKIFPVVPVAKNISVSGKEEKTTPVFVVTKPVPVADQPVAKNNNPGEVRNKRTRDK
jgi:hypothetical protein